MEFTLFSAIPALQPGLTSGWLDRFFDQILPAIVSTPLVAMVIALDVYMGSLIAFLLFDYRRNDRCPPRSVNLAFGLGYTCLVFALFNWKTVTDMTTPVNIDSLESQTLKTTIVGFGALFLVLILVTIIRERNHSGQEGMQ